MSAVLQRANTDSPVGLLTGTKEDAIVRVEGRVRDAKAFADIVVASRNGEVVRLADLGTLVEREREPDSISRVDGVPAISFQVYKQQDANIVETGQAIKDAAEELRKTMPPGVELRLVYADSDWVGRSLDGVKHTLIEGALLTVAIVFLFLHSWRSDHHHRPDAADLRDLGVHRRVPVRLHAELHDDDGAEPVHRPADRRRDRRAREHRAPPPSWARATGTRRSTAPKRSAWR